MLKTLWLELRVISMAHFMGAHSFQLVLAIGVLEREAIFMQIIVDHVWMMFIRYLSVMFEDFRLTLQTPATKTGLSTFLSLNWRPPMFALQSCWILTHKLLSSCRRRILEELSKPNHLGGKNFDFLGWICETLWNAPGFRGLTTVGKLRCSFVVLYIYIYIS